MTLKPLGDRVLVRPYKNPNVTASGLLHLPENRAEQSLEMQGEVVSVGRMTHPRKAEAEALADQLAPRISDLGLTFQDQIVDMLRDLVRREPLVKVGDDVLFSWAVGQEITIDDDKFLLLKESDILAVLETA